MAGGRSLPWKLGLLAMALSASSLLAGLQFDDYLLRERLRTAGLLEAAGRLFVFMDGDPAHTLSKMESGDFPWYALPEGQLAFGRPLTAFTHWLDFQLWPEQPILMHAHSLAWSGLMVATVTCLYRRVHATGRAAALASLAFAIDDAHGFATGWLSNRNVLLATSFGALSLGAHLRWRRDGWRPGAWLAPGLLALGLLSAEAAGAVLAYLLAFAVFLDGGSRLARLGSLAPAALVVAAWRLAYGALGYGAWGTSYLDPAREPLQFLSEATSRAPLLLLAQWLQPPAEIAAFLHPAVARWLWGGALCFLAWLSFGLWPLLRQSASARFWAAGMLLAVLPACASLPANRLLFFVGLGAMGVLAELATDTGDAAERRARVSLRRILLAVHFGLAPLLLPLTAFSPALLGSIEPGVASLPAEAQLTRQTLVIVSAPSFVHASYISLVRSIQGLPAPARVRSLAAGPGPTTLRREDGVTLLARPDGGYLSGFDSVFRGPGHRFAVGQVVALSDVTAEVRALTPDGRPAAVAFRFHAPLEDPSLRFFRWRAGAYVPFAVPAVGETVSVGE